VRPVLAAALATALALLVSTALMIGLVGLTQIEPSLLLHDHDFGHEEEHGIGVPQEISLARFAQIVLPISLVGIILESTVTSLLIGYLLKVKPDLIDIAKDEGQMEGEKGLTR